MHAYKAEPWRQKNDDMPTPHQLPMSLGPARTPCGACDSDSDNDVLPFFLPHRDPEVAARASETIESRPTKGRNEKSSKVPAPPTSRPMKAAQHREHAAVALELFCRSAGLSYACHSVGFRIVPVDWNGNKHVTKVPVTRLDLSTEKGQMQIWHVMTTMPVKYVHMGPPCGTYSRAREKRIPKWALSKGAPNPQP